MFEVTEYQVKTVKQDGPVKAFVTIVIDDALAIHGIRIKEKKDEDGYYVQFPSHKFKEEWKDVVHPINQEVREMITDLILKAFYANLPDEKETSAEEE